MEWEFAERRKTRDARTQRTMSIEILSQKSTTNTKTKTNNGNLIKISRFQCHFGTQAPTQAPIWSHFWPGWGPIGILPASVGFPVASGTDSFVFFSRLWRPLGRPGLAQRAPGRPASWVPPGVPPRSLKIK